MKEQTIVAFLALVRAGLWEKDTCLLSYKDIDFNMVLRLAEEQLVVGLVAAGMEYVKDLNVPKDIVLQCIGESLQLERHNLAMNEFVADTVERMRNEGIYCVLVKGSGLAQCYKRPLWRACGDIDFFFSKSEYNRVVDFFNSISSKSIQDSRYTKSYGVIIDDWQVELHGTLRSGLSTRVDLIIDDVQSDIFYGGDVRSWIYDMKHVLLPGVNSDLFLLFTHFVRHFYHHEFILRQLCDWCRFLWNYRKEIDIRLLEKRLKDSNLMPEWKAFAVLVVDHLGMPKEVMPFYDDSPRRGKKADKILAFTLMGGVPNRVSDTIAMAKMFPTNTFRFLPSLLFNVCGMKIKERLLEKL